MLQLHWSQQHHEQVTLYGMWTSEALRVCPRGTRSKKHDQQRNDNQLIIMPCSRVLYEMSIPMKVEIHLLLYVTTWEESRCCPVPIKRKVQFAMCLELLYIGVLDNHTNSKHMPDLLLLKHLAFIRDLNVVHVWKKATREAKKVYREHHWPGEKPVRSLDTFGISAYTGQIAC